MTKVLLLTDFSENATQAIKYAFKLWSGQACKFYLLNVQKTSEFTTDDLITAKPHESIFASIIADNKAQLASYVEMLRPLIEGQQFQLSEKVDYDVFTDSVNQVVKANDIDYVVLGTNGATGAAEAIFGSNTMQLIRNVKCPTIVVPEGFEFRPLEEVLYSQTEKFTPEPEELTPVIDLLEGRNSYLHLLAIHTPGANDLEGLKSTLNEMANNGLFKDIRTEVETLEDLAVPQAVDAYQQLHKVDLHVFLVQSESFLKRFLFGTDAGQVSMKTRVPLLVLHHK